ncbi:MAG: hypothetical protein NTV87_09490 [Ignavibacteriae bacterium]|nr:hypothetical protein [Ignavibacteriota bacterium]
MKLKNFKIITLLIILILSSLVYSKPRVTIGGPYRQSPDVVVVQRVFLNANNINAIFQNTGIFNQDTRTTNTPGLEWPKGSHKFACFTAGLSIGCGIGGQYAQTMASYKGEYSPGYYDATGTYKTSPDFKMYVVRMGDNAVSNPDYANWYKMVPYGAPYTDINKNQQFDPDIDVPGQTNAGETIFYCMTDGDLTQHAVGEGFGGGITIPLMKVEAHFTAWAYTTPGLEDLEFVNWVVINKGASTWDSTFMGIVVDPDLGDANDDYIGSEPTLNMGYVYNADDNDPVYGQAPPAFGMDYFKSPIIKRPGLPNDTIGMTSFVFFTNNGNNPPPCESDPNGEPVPAYHMLQGFKKDRTPFMDVTKVPPASTKFVYPGDPETGSGWTEYKGSMTNCNGDTISTTSNTLSINPAGDRRFIFNSGRLDFQYKPGDTQNIVVAQFVQRGSNNKNSVTRLKRIAKTAKIIYDNNFNVTPPPPPPVVNAGFTPLLNGLCNINLSWGDISETYNYWDSIFYMPKDSNIYKFQGYEVYEINKYANSIPDFTKPYTVDPTLIKLVATFDKRDNIGLIVDTFSTGTIVGTMEVFAPFPIVPPFNLPVPTGFPNSGISRAITVTSTAFAQNYGGQSSFIYGQEYQFAVVAYGVSTADSLARGFKVIRNSVSTGILKIRPIAPPAGTIFTYENGDTLLTSSRDLTLTPVIRNMDLLKDATYRVQFNSDTTYSLMRRLVGAVKFDTLNRNLKALNIKTTSDDSSRTVDGVFINFQKIRFTNSPNGNYIGNAGVIKDPSFAVPDSIQSNKYGFEYSNPANQFLLGSRYVRDPSKAWQSVMMSLSYPTTTTFTAIRSGITNDRLRKVTIEFTAPGQGQMAYWYRDTSLTSDNFYIYQGIAAVPFKVYADTVLVDDPTIPSFIVQRRQINVGFVESADTTPGHQYLGWNPTNDSLGSKLLLYVFGSSYDTTIASPYKSRNLFLNQSQFDIMYVWSPWLVTPGAAAGPGELLYFYPYSVTRPYVNGNVPLYYEFSTTKPVFGDPNNAKTTNAMSKIKVVPNPYYGFSTLDRSAADKFVTFRNLPANCTIKLYTLNGDLIRTLTKSGNGSSASTLEWNLQNMENVPVASGIYVALIDAPGIGQKILKLAIFVSQERINF